MDDDPPIPDDSSWQSGELGALDDLREALQERARTGQPMRGFKLGRTQLRDVNLVNAGSKVGFSLTNSDFYRADLRDAHLFMLDLSGSSLMKADLRNANLHCANLSGCNLLGTRLESARIEHVEWGEVVVQEDEARRTPDRKKRLALYEEAEEVYRNLRKTAEAEGLFETAGRFFQREMVMRRMQMPLISARRAVSKIVDLFCGYGEQPLRVVAFSVLLVITFGAAYFFGGMQFEGEHLNFTTSVAPAENLRRFGSAMYFSVVTFTTLGFGDIAPLGMARALAATEAFIGSFTLALFVVVFVKKMTR